MTKQELRELAAVGYVAKLKRIEAELANAFEMFPEVFVGPTAPQLVRPELRNGFAKKNWPISAVIAAHAGKSKSKGKRGKGKGSRAAAIAHARKGSAEGGRAAQILAQRTRSASMLAVIGDTGVPVTPEQFHDRAGADPRVLGSLVRRGYVKRTRKGFIRTAKVFVVDKRKAAQ